MPESDLKEFVTVADGEEEAFPDWSVRILTRPDRLRLFRLDPDVVDAPGPNTVDGHPILGEVDIRSPVRMAKIGEILVSANRELGDSAECFDPDFGVVAERDGQSVTLAICFACSNVMLSGEAGGGFYFMSSRPGPYLGWVYRITRLVRRFGL